MERVSILTFRTVNYVLDAIIFVAAYVFGLMVWNFNYQGLFNLDFFFSLQLESALIPFLIFYGTNFFCLAFSRIYHSSRLRPLSSCLFVYLRSVSLALLVTALSSILFGGIVFISRSLLVATVVGSFAMLAGKELLIRANLKLRRQHGLNLRRAIIVGKNPELVAHIVKECEHDFLLGIHLVGTVSPYAEPVTTAPAHALTELGGVGDLARIVKEYYPDIVIFFAQELKNQLLTESLWLCEERGLEVWLKLDLLDRIIYQATVNSIQGVPFISFYGGPSNPSALLFKYAMDRVLSSIILILLSPVFLAIALAIKLNSPGPVIFRQVRAGLNGRRFEVLKFRSMVLDAEERKGELQEMNEMSGPVFKVSKDPRVTKIGRFLRKTSLDELPQLWNVFRGEMSLVGPRPMDVKEVEHIEGWHRRRLTMKPGITCIWQTAGRNKIANFDDWAKLDLEYIDNWSLWLDLVLLIKTVPVVLFGRGAS